MESKNLDPKTVSAWRHHRQDEFDAAYLYRTLAEIEPDPHSREIYQRLASVEDRHVQLWEDWMREQGTDLPAAKPSLRARLMAWLAHRFGPALLLTLLLREEGEEVKKYLALHDSVSGETTQEISLRLARESVQHASTLRELSGTEGEPWHQAESGDFLRNVVYGFNDGLTANFGLVAGVLGADVHSSMVLLSGVAGMIADSLSMASSGYLAAKSQQEVYDHEIAMEKEEIRLMPQLEEEELALIYEAKGIEKQQAARMAREVMSVPERALQEKVREELKIGDVRSTPLKEGWITGTATAVGALIPVAPFMVLEGAAAVWTSFVLSMLSHFAVGAARSVFTGRGIFRSGIDMFLVGLGVAGVGYLFGDLLTRWFIGTPIKA